MNDNDIMTDVQQAPDPAAVAALPKIDLARCALLLDIDGTLLELAPTPREVVVPPDLRSNLVQLLEATSGALALVSGRSLIDIDWIFEPTLFPAVGGHGAEMRLSGDTQAVASHAPPMDPDLKKRFADIARLDKGILLEDKGYSIALHFRKAPHIERALYDAVSVIRADLPDAAIAVLPGKFVCEIKASGISKASGVQELLTHEPFAGRMPVFLGDDVTDETVFAIMPDLKGLSFSVGRRARGVQGYFESPRDVRNWIADLLRNRRR